MQFRTGFIALALVLAHAAGPAFASSCNHGGVYCGQSLLNKGNYREHIIRVLEAAGQSTDERHIINSIFDCLDKGEIRYRGYCANGCGGVGSTDPDYCL